MISRGLGDALPRVGIGVLIAACLALLIAVPSAQARDSFAFAGTYDFGGQFGTGGPGPMDIHQASDTLYVVDPPNERILKFDISDPLNPQPSDFAALANNAITEVDGSPLSLSPRANVAVDNSGGPQDGTIYLATNTASDSRAHAYGANGGFLYTFAHAGDDTFSLTGTPQTGRAVAVANEGPRAGEIFRLGINADVSSTYTPSRLPGEPPEVRIPRMVRSGFIVPQFNDALSVGYSDGGETVQLAIPGFFGAVNTSHYRAAALEPAGNYNFGSWGTPFDVKVAPDGTILVRRSTGPGGFGRFHQTGVSKGPFPGPPASGTEVVELFGFGEQGAGVGMVESEAGYLYATDTSQQGINIFEPATAPDAEQVEPGFVDISTARLRAEVDPLGLDITTCQFHWGTTTTYGNAAPCDAIPSGSGKVTVTADIPVAGGTIYHSQFEVSADNDTATFSDDLEWLAPNLPEAVTFLAGPIQRQGTAVLGGTVDANKTPTGYFIEYSTDPGMSQLERFPADENALAGNADTPQRVFLTVPALRHDETYYFRLVAETKAGRDEGAVESFTTFADPSRPQPNSCANTAFRKGPSASLPDCRAWEQISPQEKAGGWVSQGRIIPSTDGSRVTFSSPTAFSGDVLGLGVDTLYLAERGAVGWQTFAVNPPFTLNQSATGNGVGYRAFTPDLSRMLGVDNNIALGGAETPTSNSTMFLWDTGAEAVSVLKRSAYNRMLVGAPATTSDDSTALSGDGEVAFFRARDEISVDNGPTVSGTGLYWWSEADGVSLASTLPNGQPATTGFPSATAPGFSTDGKRLLWSMTETVARPGSPELMLSRRNGQTSWITQADGVTQPAHSGLLDTNIGGSTGAAWTPDLRFIYFPSEAQLTADATASPDAADLYRFDAENESLVNLTTADPAGGGVEKVLQTSDDGRRVYFIATGILAPGASGPDKKLYVLHEGGIRFITNFHGDTELLGFDSRSYDRLSRISDDGRYLLFAHNGSTVGTAMESIYETNGHRLLYRYDFASDRIDCVSCHPRGNAATADTYLTMPATFRSNGFDAPPIGPERYFMSDAGGVMFVTKQALLPTDNNQAHDTYLWDGDLRLITSGSGSWPQWAEAASEDFEEIFVLTARPLVPSDIDHDGDVYVAKVNGGLASQQVAPYLSDPGCAGTACQGLGSDRPVLPRLDSAKAEPELPPVTTKRCLVPRRNAARRAVKRYRTTIRSVRAARRVSRQVSDGKRAKAVRRALRKRHQRLKRVKRAHRRAKVALRHCRQRGAK